MSVKKIFIIVFCFLILIMMSGCKDSETANSTSIDSNKNIYAGNSFSSVSKEEKDQDVLDEKIYGSYSIRDLLQLSKEQDIAYAGKYLDKNGMNIMLLYKSAKNMSQLELQQKISDASKILGVRFQDAKFTSLELQKINETLLRNMDYLAGKGVTGFAIDEKDNRIKVTVKKINDDIKNEVGKIVDLSAVEFEEGTAPTFD